MKNGVEKENQTHIQTSHTRTCIHVDTLSIWLPWGTACWLMECAMFRVSFEFQYSNGCNLLHLISADICPSLVIIERAPINVLVLFEIHQRCALLIRFSSRRKHGGHSSGCFCFVLFLKGISLVSLWFAEASPNPIFWQQVQKLPALPQSDLITKDWDKSASHYTY